MDSFLLKKILSNFVHVVPAAFIALLICIALLGRFPRMARTSLLLICLMLLGFSSPPVSNAIVGTLENQYPVVQVLPQDTALVLVLGSGHHWSADRPANSVLKAQALSRLAEGVRLWKSRPGASLMLGGAKFRSEISHAQAMSNMALEWGVEESAIVLEPEVRDTAEEIAAALKWLQSHAKPGRTRLVVVSSAIHLPRAADLLRSASVDYTLAPTDFRQLDAPWYRFNSVHLYDVDWTLHEYVGLFWNRLAN